MKTIDKELYVTLDGQKIKLGLFLVVLEGTTWKLKQEISSIKNKAKKDYVQLRE